MQESWTFRWSGARSRWQPPHGLSPQLPLLTKELCKLLALSLQKLDPERATWWCCWWCREGRFLRAPLGAPLTLPALWKLPYGDQGHDTPLNLPSI